MLCPGSRADFFFSHPLVQSPALGWVTMVIRVYVGITLAVTRVRGQGNGLCSMMHLGGLWGHGAGCCPRAQLPAERHQAALIKGEIGGMGAKHLQGAVTWTWTDEQPVNWLCKMKYKIWVLVPVRKHYWICPFFQGLKSLWKKSFYWCRDPVLCSTEC